jgi:hypothetical protein
MHRLVLRVKSNHFQLSVRSEKSVRYHFCRTDLADTTDFFSHEGTKGQRFHKDFDKEF